VKDRRDLKPDAQAFDKIIIETQPRWKDSESSGSEWRIGAVINFYRKGKLVTTSYAGSVAYAAYLCGARHIEACDNGAGFFAGEGDICDQEGCDQVATVLAKKKFDYSRDGHKSESASSAYRIFCDKHSTRGDCGLDDSDANYSKGPLVRFNPEEK